MKQKIRFSIGKRSLAFVLTLFMVFGNIGLFSFLFAEEFTAQAASVKAASVASNDLIFVVPEVIYLFPNAKSSGYSTSSPFQFFVNNNSDGTVKTEYDNVGYIYYSLSGAGNATVSGTFLTESLGTLSGGSISLSGSTITNGSSVTVTRSSKSPSLGSTTNGCFILWTLSYTDPADNVAKKAYAYSYVYKPYVVPVPAGADAGTGTDGGANWAGSVTWISGVHSITAASSTNMASDWDSRWFGYSKLSNFSAFISKESTGYVGDAATTGSNDLKNDYGQTTYDNWVSDATKWYTVFRNSGSSGYYLQIPGNSNPSCYHSGNSATDTAPVKNYMVGKYRENTKNVQACVYNTSYGNLYIDTSRYSNLKDIPNLGVGLIVTDDENSDDKSGGWYIADFTGKSTSGYNTWHTGSDNGGSYYSDHGDFIARQGTGRTAQPASEHEGVRYSGAWPRTLLGTTSSTAGATYDYMIKGAYGNHDGGYYAWSHCVVKMHAIYYNKGTLRTAVNNALKKFPALGVNGISGTNITSCYFDADTNYKWTDLQSAFTAACKGLTLLNNTTNTQTLADNLNNALAALCTKVTFATSNSNKGTITTVSGKTNPAYVTIGTAQSVSITPATYVTATAKPGYSFDGWSTSSTATSGSNSVTVGYNNTLYAIWKPISYTVHYDGNGNTGGSTANSTHTYDTAKNLTANGFTRAYTVTYNGNGGTPTIASNTATYTFNGWEGSQRLINDTKEYSYNNTSGSAYYDVKQWTISAPFAANEVFVLEFDAKGSGSLTNYFYGEYANGQPNYWPIASVTSSTGAHSMASDGNIQTALTSSYQHVRIVFTLAASGNANANKYVLFRALAGQSITFKNVVFYKVTGAVSYSNQQSVTNLCSVSGAVYEMRAKWTPSTVSVTLPSASKASDANNHYTFDGWYDAATGGNKIGNAGASYTPTANKTLYAHYTSAAHTPSGWQTDANQHWKVCTACQYITTAKANHSYGSWSADTATCTAAGSQYRDCSCGYRQTQATSALGHITVTDAAVAPTCTTAGKTEGSHCSRCYTVLTAQTTVAALGHAPVTDAAVAATCTETGLTAGTHCSRCSTVLTAQTTVAALGHAPVTDAAVAATCTETGLTAGAHCSRCSTVLTAQTTVAALGHDYGTASYSWNGTSSCTGTRTCSRDTNHKETQNATVTNEVTTAATCTDTGVRTYTATFTNSAFSAQTKTETIAINPYNHASYGQALDSTTVSEPTYSAAGYTGDKKCAGCHAVRTAGESIPALQALINLDDVALEDISGTSGKVALAPTKESDIGFEIVGFVQSGGDHTLYKTKPSAPSTLKMNGVRISIGSGGDKIEYKFTKMDFTTLPSFYALVKVTGTGNHKYSTNDIYTYQKVTLVPAKNVMFDDTVEAITYTNSTNANPGYGIWSRITDSDSAVTEAVDTFGDVATAQPNTENSVKYSFGDAHRVSVSNTLGTAWPKAQFTFTGSGFDLISVTDSNSGVFAVFVYEGTDTNGTLKRRGIIDTYYGYSYGQLYYVPWDPISKITIGAESGGTQLYVADTESEDWDESKAIYNQFRTAVYTTDPDFAVIENAAPKLAYGWIQSESSDVLYQVPCISYDLGTVGTYTVVVEPRFTEMFGHYNENNNVKYYNFTLDGVRIYNPAGNNKLAKDTYEANGELYTYYELFRDAANNGASLVIDGMTSLSRSDVTAYLEGAPNNELYLMPGGTAAFDITFANLTDAKIGLKAANGSACNVMISNGTSAFTVQVNTATEQYISIRGLLAAGTASTVTVTNSGSGILSLTKLMTTTNTAPSTPSGAPMRYLSVGPETENAALAAVTMLNADIAIDESTVEAAAADDGTVTVTLQTGADAETIVVRDAEGNVIDPDSITYTLDETGVKQWAIVLTHSEEGIYTYTLQAEYENGYTGNAEPTAVNVSVMYPENEETDGVQSFTSLLERIRGFFLRLIELFRQLLSIFE